MSEKIAAVIIEDLPEDPSANLSLERITCNYQQTLQEPVDESFDWPGSRICCISLPNATDKYKFVVDQQLLDYLGQHVTDPTAPTQAELVRHALEQPGREKVSTAVDPVFRADALNDINASYYAADIAFTPEAGLATLYAGSRTINRALGALIAGETPDEHMRVKELCSGGLTAHWKYIFTGAQEKGVHSMEATLTDFVPPPISDTAQSESLTCTSEVYSLFDSFASLPAADRYNAMIATYGFDSIWLPEDIFLTRDDKDRWYQTLFRVKVADWNPRQQELLAAMRQAKALPNASVADYKGIAVEEARQPYNIDDHPFAEHLATTRERSFMFPGGLVRRVVEAFDAQLRDDGVFINADVGNFGDDLERLHYPPYRVSGVAAHYHAADYLLAGKVLRKEFDLNTQFYQIDELVARTLEPDWQESATWLDRRLVTRKRGGSGVMVVTR